MNPYAVMVLAFCGVYGVFMVVQGMSNFRKTSGSTETFLAADRGVNPFMLVCSTAVSVFSGLTYYGWPSSVYKQGVGYVTGLGAFCTGLLFCLMGYRLWLLGKEYGFQTPSEYLRARYYSEGYGLFCAVLLIAFIVPYVSLQLITIGDGLNVSTKGVMPYFLAVLIACAIIAFHVFGGGMKAIAFMDTFNFLLAVGALYILVAYLIAKYFPGGMKEVVSIVLQNERTAANLGAPGATGYFDWRGCINQSLTASVATIVWPHIFSRCFVAKSKKNFEIMAWGLPLGYMVTFIGIMMLGVMFGPAALLIRNSMTNWSPHFRPSSARRSLQLFRCSACSHSLSPLRSRCFCQVPECFPKTSSRTTASSSRESIPMRRRSFRGAVTLSLS